MRLLVDPDDVRAAASALALTARRLEAAIEDFAVATGREAPDLGRDATTAAVHSATAAQRAAQVVAGDIRTLARALRELAQVYADLDVTAVPEPP